MKRILTTIALLACVASDGYALAPPVFSHEENITANVSGPARVAVDTAGNIYIADDAAGVVNVLDRYGARRFIIGRSDIPRAVAVDASRRIYAGYMSNGGPGYVAVYDPSGQFLRYLGSGVGEFGLPGDIAVSFSTGRLYVLDSIQNGVKVYDGDGNSVSSFGGQGQRGDCFYSAATSNPGKFDFPGGIAVDDIRGEVLVSDQNNYRVQIFDFDGNFKTAFGTCTQERSFGSWPSGYYQGKFSSIRGLAVDREGRIYVADAFAGTVQVLDRTGTYLAFIGGQGTGAEQLNVPTDVVIDNKKRLVVADWNNNRLSLFQTDSGPAVNNMPPGAPVQVSPANSVQINTVTPTFTVYNAEDPNGDHLNYRFEIDTSPAFTSPVSTVAAEGNTYTSATSPQLTDHMVYFWRARAGETDTSEMLSGGWSASRSFYVNAVNRPPSTPTGLLPAAGSTAVKSTYLSWSAAADPDLYDTVTYSVRISEKADFSSILISRDGIGNTGKTISDLGRYALLKSGKEYFWRVTAVDNHGASSAASSPGSFIYRQTMLRITSNPSGARVWIDGNHAYLGHYYGVTLPSTPLEITEIEPGRHVVRVEKPGWFGWYRSIVLKQGETTTVDAVLTEDEEGVRPFSSLLADAAKNAIPGNRPFVIDWDNDGRDDLLVGGDDGRMYLYENISVNASPVYALSDKYPEGVVMAVGAKAAPFVADWDNDGKKDLLAGCSDGAVRLYINQGSDESPLFADFTNLSANGAAILTSGNAVPFVVDWNNDGKKDLVVGESSGKARLYINIAADDAPAFGDGGYIRAGGAGLAVAADAAPFITDWNLDGRKDILMGSADGLKVFLNAGTDDAPSFAAATPISVTGAGTAPFVLDYDGDGYTDLLAGDEGGHVGYYRFKSAESPDNAGLVKRKEKKGLKKFWKSFKFW